MCVAPPPAASPVSGPFVTGLRCRACGHRHDTGFRTQVCERCWGPLDVAIDGRAAAAALTLAPSEEPEPGGASMWRYAPLLASPDPGAAAAGIGRTPLVRAGDLGATLGLTDLWLKDETANPSGSFKDRLVAGALAVGRAHGCRVAACASTGNLASALAALAPRFGMAWTVIVPATVEPARLAALDAAPGGAAVVVDGDYDTANRLGGELSDEHPDWAWVNVGLRPWYADAARTLAFEVAEDLGWRAPDHVVVPMASGATAVKLAQGFAELCAAGLVPRVPRLTVVQPEGCAPVAAAFARGDAEVTPVRAATVASSLAMGDPPDGRDVLAAVRGTDGVVDAVPEAQIGPALDQLSSSTGLAADAAAGVVVAALRRLAGRGLVGAGELVVAYVTGAAMAKAPGGARAAAPVPATVAAFEAALEGAGRGLA